MSSLESVLDEARKLPPEEQRELAEKLLEENKQPPAAEGKPIWEVLCEIGSRENHLRRCAVLERAYQPERPVARARAGGGARARPGTAGDN